jgi:probable rRNA maturation factor
MPDLSIHDHQGVVVLDLARMAGAVRAALEKVIREDSGRPGSLAGLDEVEISFVDDEAIGRVHGEFLGDPEPTDVITFDHGEILISAETGQRRAEEFGHSAERECVLYAVHGMLHLQGFDDHEAGDAARMKEVQERILGEVWPWEGGA